MVTGKHFVEIRCGDSNSGVFHPNPDGMIADPAGADRDPAAGSVVFDRIPKKIQQALLHPEAVTPDRQVGRNIVDGNRNVAFPGKHGDQ